MGEVTDRPVGRWCVGWMLGKRLVTICMGGRQAATADVWSNTHTRHGTNQGSSVDRRTWRHANQRSCADRRCRTALDIIESTVSLIPRNKSVVIIICGCSNMSTHHTVAFDYVCVQCVAHIWYTLSEMLLVQPKPNSSWLNWIEFTPYPNPILITCFAIFERYKYLRHTMTNWKVSISTNQTWGKLPVTPHVFRDPWSSRITVVIHRRHAEPSSSSWPMNTMLSNLHASTFHVGTIFNGLESMCWIC